MKRFILILSLVLFCTNTSYAGTAVSNKAEIKAVKQVLKSQIQYANKYDLPSFIKFFDPKYINSDGFNLDIYSKLVEETWAAHSNIQYAQTVKNISINGADAIAEVTEIANAKIESPYNLSGYLKSTANNIYFLRKTDDGWKIVSDIILTEDTCLSFGELTKYNPVLTVPPQTIANKNYTAILKFEPPENTIALASLTQERISYPQETIKENYRKLPDDGVLERFFTANNDETNEYIVAALGLTKPVFENKDLQIQVVGAAYIMKRVNVIPENKLINKEGVIPVNERIKPQDTESKNVDEASNVNSSKNDKVTGEDKPVGNESTEIKNRSVAPDSDSNTNTETLNEKVKKEDESADIESEKKSEQEPKNTEDNTAGNEVIQSSEPPSTIPDTEVKAETEKQEVSESETLDVKQESVQENTQSADKNSVVLPGDKATDKTEKSETSDEVSTVKTNTKIKKIKTRKEKSLKGTYSPEAIDIPTSETVCRIDSKQPDEQKSDVKEENVKE